MLKAITLLQCHVRLTAKPFHGSTVNARLHLPR